MTLMMIMIIMPWSQVLSSGNYSRLCADILFSRSSGYYIIQARFSLTNSLRGFLVVLCDILPVLEGF